MTRRLVLAVLASLALLASATPALAHNGVGAAFKGRAGGFELYAYDGYPVAGGALSYRLVVLDAKTGDPVDQAQVAVAARPEGANTAQPVAAASLQVYANVVFYVLPNPYPGSWLVTVTVPGGHATFSMHGAYVSSAPPGPVVTVEGGGGTTGWAIGLGIAALAVPGIGLVLWWRRRSNRGAEVSGG